MNRFRRLISVGATALAAGRHASASAQGARTLRVIVPFAARGPLDPTVDTRASLPQETICLSTHKEVERWGGGGGG